MTARLKCGWELPSQEVPSAEYGKMISTQAFDEMENPSLQFYEVDAL